VTFVLCTFASSIIESLSVESPLASPSFSFGYKSISVKQGTHKIMLQHFNIKLTWHMYKISFMILDEHFSLGGKREKLRA
jgi:hypothetical protein